MTRRCHYPVFDADNHLYETQDAFTRHLPKRYRRATPKASRTAIWSASR